MGGRADPTLLQNYSLNDIGGHNQGWTHQSGLDAKYGSGNQNFCRAYGFLTSAHLGW